ncbi:hypothetical protein [Paenibacillus albus]|uniref:Uncharacterized protein n=1 Tax=Paenibacillus albus TaxID=2495582 RepID=A0A3S9A6Z4_9BACL|nr:hypothetical protein [Paenibacillus albus]AZN41537.1 hypothetical protein EJC50_19020 [Paenibacillus albus]
MNFWATTLVRDSKTGEITLTPLKTQEFRYDDVDTGETRSINYAPIQSKNLVGVSITITGFEVDSEDSYKNMIQDFGKAFEEGLSSTFAKIASLLTTAVGGAIAVLAGAAFAVAGPVIAAAALVITCATALFYASWAPADPIIEDYIGLSLIELSALTDSSSPMPAQTQTISPSGIKVVVDSISKNIDFSQLRGNISDDEDSLYQIRFKYSRNV